MEHQAIQLIGDDDADEEYSEEFQCCVCLDIMFKPVVLACGHISCFWCVFHAMDSYEESHCPVCRNPYAHFPRSCGLFHALLLKLYPTAYKRKQRQVEEEEKIHGNESQQLDIGEISSLLGVNTTDIIPAASSSQDAVADETNCIVGDSNPVSASDLQCVVCMDLLCRPVVLNCGHVFCKACIYHQHDNINECKCPVCQSTHPNGFPSVCLVLEHFLEEHFREEYSARKELVLTLESAGPSGEKQEPAQCSLVPNNDRPSSFSGPIRFHHGAGCDYCGMYPIIGIRYKCKDCVEKIGFDLCEGCHKNSSNLSGRFNQQHTQEHQFLAIQPHFLGNIRMSLGDEYDGDMGEYEPDFVTSTPEEIDPSVPDYPRGLAVVSDSSESLGSSVDDYSQDLEDALASPRELSVDRSLF